MHNAQEPISGVPTQAWLIQSGEDPAFGTVPHHGDLSEEDIGGVNNWIKREVALGNLHLRCKWLPRVCQAHGFTLLIAHQLCQSKNLPFPANENYVSKAREKQYILSRPMGAEKMDIDKEALANLEQLMMDRSQTRGRAGKFQWGLDTGMHQGRWDPYHECPFLTEEEHTRDVNPLWYFTGPDYIEEKLVSPKPTTKIQPRPTNPQLRAEFNAIHAQVLKEKLSDQPSTPISQHAVIKQHSVSPSLPSPVKAPLQLDDLVASQLAAQEAEQGIKRSALEADIHPGQSPERKAQRTSERPRGQRRKKRGASTRWTHKKGGKKKRDLSEEMDLDVLGIEDNED
ncbi:hypothetical protein NP233_g13036 [Leucocoprinus birnbaumii]|uniref:Uncharacterized protein n=1 Tax=Leucocoprinus birnbaumii TaxID=56174 RepID=A0AAD5VJ05_9AGAR|nr:hypothetical protein NP233_g13036 [Leucocoprinus birnbaumii]